MQNSAEDWNFGSKGCHDAASLARLQSTLKYDFKAVADGNTQSCLSQPLERNIVQHLLSETYKAAPRSLGLLMADHTQVSQLLQVITFIHLQAASTWSMHAGYIACSENALLQSTAAFICAMQADWRPVLPNISIPCLNVVGSKTQCFHVDGVTYVGNHVPSCKTVRMHDTKCQLQLSRTKSMYRCCSCKFKYDTAQITDRSASCT